MKTIQQAILTNPELSNAELASYAGILDEPQLVPLSELNEILLASGGWAALQTIANTPGDYAGLALTTLGLFQGKLENFDARKTEYRGLLNAVLEMLKGFVPNEAIRQIKDRCGVDTATPTEEQFAAARASMALLNDLNKLRDELNATIAKVDALFDRQRAGEVFTVPTLQDLI